jgi:hypothetical protein
LFKKRKAIPKINNSPRFVIKYFSIDSGFNFNGRFSSKIYTQALQQYLFCKLLKVNNGAFNVAAKGNTSSKKYRIKLIITIIGFRAAQHCTSSE